MADKTKALIAAGASLLGIGTIVGLGGYFTGVAVEKKKAAAKKIYQGNIVISPNEDGELVPYIQINSNASFIPGSEAVFNVIEKLPQK